MGKGLLSGSRDGTVRLWDVSTGRELKRYASGAGAVTAVAVSPDGKAFAAACSNNTVALWDAGSRAARSAAAGHHDEVLSLSFSLDGNRLASGAYRDTAVYIWDPLTSAAVARFSEVGQRPAHFMVALSPDAKTLVSWAPGGTVRVRESASGKRLGGLGTEAHVTCVAWSPDGAELALGSQTGAVYLWRCCLRGALPRLLATHPGPVARVNFTPDGKTLAAVQRDSVYLWEVASEKSRGVLHAERQLAFLALTADSQSLASGAGSRIWRWRLGACNELGSIELDKARLTDLVFSADGRFLLGLDGGRQRTWDIAGAKEVTPLVRGQGRLSAIAISPDGRMLATGQGDGTILLWNTSPLRSAAVEGAGAARAGRHAGSIDSARLWHSLASSDAGAAYRAIGEMTDGGAQTCAFLLRHLSAAAAVRPGTVAHLIRELDSKQFGARNRAERELIELGSAVEPQLHQALTAGCGPEVQRRIHRILERSAGPVTSTEELRALRAVEVLEHVGNSDAREILRRLARGASASRLTRAASASLARLGQARER
jgi:WD40 repeat protein